MKSKEDLLNEWIRLRGEAISYQRLGIDDNMTTDAHVQSELNYNRRKEIELELFSLGYEIADGEKPYEIVLKKL